MKEKSGSGRLALPPARKSGPEGRGALLGRGPSVVTICAMQTERIRGEVRDKQMKGKEDRDRKSGSTCKERKCSEVIELDGHSTQTQEELGKNP
jgi:hypothetical protein